MVGFGRVTRVCAAARKHVQLIIGQRRPHGILAASQPVVALDRVRPIYPYPKIAKYTGTGSPGDAANFIPADQPGQYSR
jgi:hypothetical protein